MSSLSVYLSVLLTLTLTVAMGAFFCMIISIHIWCVPKKCDATFGKLVSVYEQIWYIHIKNINIINIYMNISVTWPLIIFLPYFYWSGLSCSNILNILKFCITLFLGHPVYPLEKNTKKLLGFEDKIIFILIEALSSMYLPHHPTFWGYALYKYLIVCPFIFLWYIKIPK